MTVKPFSQLAPDLMALAERVRKLADPDARETLPTNTLDIVRESNADMFASRGRAIGAMWGSYRSEYKHPLPKYPGVRYWLIDTDYFADDGLRSSLTQVGRSRNSVVTWRKSSVGWRSLIPYADKVNAQYGTIYGLTDKARNQLLQGVRRRTFAYITRGAQ